MTDSHREYDQCGCFEILSDSDHSEMHFLTLETRSRISSFQSHASRRHQEFLSFGLVLRDEIENFCLMVSCFETRSRISVSWSRASRRDREFLFLVSCFETRARFSVFLFSFAFTFVKISLFNKTLCEDEWDESESGLSGKPLKPVYTDT